MARKTKYTIEDIKRVAKESISLNEMLPKLGLKKCCGNWKTIKSKIIEHDIDTSHFLGMAHMKGKTNIHSPKKAFDEILIENSTYKNMSRLKIRLLNANLLENKCYECGQQSIWKDKPLVMVLDHINGVNNDHRIENLRMLCPNCNSQQDTFAGRNRK